MILYQLRRWHSGDADRDSILYKVINKNPIKLAEQAAREEDFRLISLAMGYMASEEDASIIGVECSGPVEMQSVVFGCVPPPVVVFKKMIRYNNALI